MDIRAFGVAAAVVVGLASCGGAAPPAPPRPALSRAVTSAEPARPPPDPAPGRAEDLDAIVKRVMAEEKIVGASVLVARGDRVVLHEGYGLADLGLEVRAKDETVYHVVGPMLPFTGIAVMQQVERGKLSLDDDVSKYVPELPMQGHHVTIRQLLNHTSGIVDYHYLGDPIEATSRQPKALDEVMALYAGKSWVNPPGEKWDWSISGFQLLVTIVERVTGQAFADYARQSIFGPAGVASTTYCDDTSVVRGLAHAYRRAGDVHVPAHESATAYNSDLRFCSTVGDLHRLWRSIREKRLVAPETFARMTTAEGAAVHTSAQDPKAQYGFAILLGHEEDHRRVGQHGSLLGYAGSLYEFPEDHLTIVVLTNTEGQNALAITRALSRAILGLPELPPHPSPPDRTLDDGPISAADRRQLAGTFVLKVERVTPNLHDSFAQYRRTYRVFDENGRLMIEALGEAPERLLKQPDGSFAVRSSPEARIVFTPPSGRPAAMKIDSPGFPLSGARVGEGDPKTFHQQMR